MTPTSLFGDNFADRGLIDLALRATLSMFKRVAAEEAINVHTKDTSSALRNPQQASCTLLLSPIVYNLNYIRRVQQVARI